MLAYIWEASIRPSKFSLLTVAVDAQARRLYRADVPLYQLQLGPFAINTYSQAPDNMGKTLAQCSHLTGHTVEYCPVSKSLWHFVTMA